ncbi:hypothetical protein TRFO_09072 [Tritrichomonas foetus]|uniref:Uncharacterized protein n=1 Tax=Tritrichomonas foetus TaxID=1144522 RepID=A0A1J4JHJ4_9EUKA|nr:hypothetical protein TRFO_09072 [Tritrichomonas foetus]|eukprot:OHS98193.1 hypothetical protein TRFO_09072 [Tritrichomonas foetus]
MIPAFTLIQNKYFFVSFVSCTFHPVRSDHVFNGDNIYFLYLEKCLITAPNFISIYGFNADLNKNSTVMIRSCKCYFTVTSQETTFYLGNIYLYCENSFFKIDSDSRSSLDSPKVLFELLSKQKQKKVGFFKNITIFNNAKLYMCELLKSPASFEYCQFYMEYRDDVPAMFVFRFCDININDCCFMIDNFRKNLKDLAIDLRMAERIIMERPKYLFAVFWCQADIAHDKLIFHGKNLFSLSDGCFISNIVNSYSKFSFLNQKSCILNSSENSEHSLISATPYHIFHTMFYPIRTREFSGNDQKSISVDSNKNKDLKEAQSALIKISIFFLLMILILTSFFSAIVIKCLIKDIKKQTNDSSELISEESSSSIMIPDYTSCPINILDDTNVIDEQSEMKRSQNMHISEICEKNIRTNYIVYNDIISEKNEFLSVE